MVHPPRIFSHMCSLGEPCFLMTVTTILTSLKDSSTKMLLRFVSMSVLVSLIALQASIAHFSPAHGQNSVAELLLRQYNEGQRAARVRIQQRNEMERFLMRQEAERRHEVLQMAYRGNPIAQYQMGVMALGSEYDEPNYADAHRWFRLSAEQGFADAQVVLGDIHYQGIGVPVNFFESVYWYKLAAAQHHSAAQYSLGVAYLRGEGVAPDSVMGFKSIKMAAEMGHATAQVHTGVAYLNGIGTTIQEKVALNWLLKSAANGHVDAYLWLGFIYAQGRGVPVNDVQVMKWFSKAFEEGYHDARVHLSEALITLGEHYSEDDGGFYNKKGDILSNRIKAYACFFMADKLGNIEASSMASDMLGSISSKDQRRKAKKFAREYWRTYRDQFKDGRK